MQRFHSIIREARASLILAFPLMIGQVGQMLIGVAESRARFDLAAKLRATIDPEDPKIDQMWGRLN